MEQVIRLFSRISVQYPRRTIIAILISTFIFGFFGSQQEVSTDNKNFLPDSTTASAIEQITEEFKSSSAIPAQIIFEVEDLYSPDTLKEILSFPNKLFRNEKISPFLDTSNPIFSYAHILLSLAENNTELLLTSDIENLIENAPSHLKTQITSMVSESNKEKNKLGMMIVFFDKSIENTQILDAQYHMHNVVKETPWETVKKARTFSSGTLQMAFEEGQKETGPLFGIAMFLILLVLIILYRTGSDVVLGAIALVFTITWMYGFGVIIGPKYLGITGHFNQMTMIIPVLLIGLAIDYAIHATSRYREELTSGKTPNNAMAASGKAVGAALILSTVTTGIGFLTNVLSPLPPMQDFGLFTFFGILSAWIIMSTFIPSTRVFLDEKRVNSGKKLQTKTMTSTMPGAGYALEKLSDSTEKRPWITILVTGIITLASLVMSLDITTTFDTKDFLPQNSEVYETISLLEERFKNRGETATILIRGDFTNPDMITATESTLLQLSLIPGVAGPAQSSLVTLAQDWGKQNLQIPNDKYSEEVAKSLASLKSSGTAPLYKALEKVDPERLASVVNTTTWGSSVIVLPLEGNSDKTHTESLRKNIIQAADPLIQTGAEVIPTSDNIITLEVMNALQSSQISSIITTILTAAFILIIFFGIRYHYPSLGILGVIPVALVIAWIMGSMSVLNISFNVITAMITALTIGIGVPYSIHIINRFLEDFQRHENIREVLHSTIKHTGAALIGSGITTILGFGVLVFSSMQPIRQFGGLTALTIFYSLLSSTVVLPAILVIWGQNKLDKKESQNSGQNEFDNYTRVASAEAAASQCP